MKKNLAILVLATLCFTGCSKEKIELECSIDKEYSTLGGYKTGSKYEVYAKDGNVTKVVSNEYVESDNEQLLTTFEQTLSLGYQNYQMKYGGYDNKINIDGNRLTSVTNIDYSKVDLEQLLNDTPALKDYTKNGKLQVEGMKKLYESVGATCK